ASSSGPCRARSTRRRSRSRARRRDRARVSSRSCGSAAARARSADTGRRTSLKSKSACAVKSLRGSKVFTPWLLVAHERLGRFDDKQRREGDMHLFATELLIDDRVRELIEDGPTMHGTTRIAAMVKRHEDEIANGMSDSFGTGPVDQRREAA